MEKVIPHHLDSLFSDGMNQTLKIPKMEESQIKRRDGKARMLPGSFLSYSVSCSVTFQCHSKNHATVECRKVGEYWIED